ncbi:MAG: hypothetical protein AB7N76_13065 [Planctomycetota bacterium]
MIRKHRNLLLSAAAMTAFSCMGMGCGSQQGGGSRTLLATGTAAPIGSQGYLPMAASGQGGLSSLPAAAGAFPAGSQFTGPVVEILSPARGAAMPAGSQPVEIQVTANQGKAVQSVFVNGRGATLDADGKATVKVDLTPGLRTIVVEAADKDGNKTERQVSVLVGQLATEGSEVAEAATVRLGDDALDLFEPAIGQGIEAQKPTIRQSVLTTKPPKDTKFTSFDFGAVTAAVDAESRGIRFRVDVANVSLGIEYKATFLLFFSKKKTGTVRAGNLIIEGLAVPSLDPATGKLSSQVTGVTASVTGFSVPDWADSAKDQLRDGFVKQFAGAASTQLDAALNAALSKAKTDGTVTKTAFGKSITAAWHLRRLTLDDEGLNAGFSVAIQADAPTYGSDATVALRTPNANLGGAGGALWNGALAIHQDTINQALHAGWRHGILSFTVDQATLDKINPTGALRLDTTAIVNANPQLEQVLPKGVPIDLDVETRLPPVVEIVENMPHQLVLSLGAVNVAWKIQDPKTGAIVTLAETVYALSAEARLEEQGGTIKLVPTGNLEVHVDVVGKALPGSEPLVEAVTAQIAPQIVQSSLGSVPGFVLPAVKGFTLERLDFSTRGQSLVATGTLTPAAKQP